MAKIPALKPSRVSAAAPRVSAASAKISSAPGEALAGLGRSLRQGGKQIGSALKLLEDKRRKADITNFGDDAAFEYKKRVNSFITDAKNRFSGSDHKGYEQEVNDFIQETEQDMTGEIDDVEKLNYLKGKIRGFQENNSLKSNGYESEKRARFFVGRRIEKIDELSSQFIDNPNPFEASKELENLDVELDQQEGLTLNRLQIDALKESARQKTRENIIFGQIRDGLPGIINEGMTTEERKKAIIDFASGKQEGTKSLFKGMSPKEHRNFEARLLSASRQIQSRQLVEIKEDVKNAIAIFESGDSTDPRIKQEILQTRVRVDNMPEGPNKEKFSQALDNAETVSDFVTGSINIPSAQLLSTNIDELIPLAGLDNARMNINSRKALVNAIQDTVEDRNEDGADYIAKNFPSLRGNIEGSIAQQRALGVTSPRVLSKSDATIQSQAILEETSPKLRVQKIQAVVESIGPKYGFQALSEMADANKKFHRGYAFSAFLRSDVSREKVITAISNREVNKQKFSTTERALIRTQIENETQDIRKSFFRANLGEFSNKFTEMIEATVMANTSPGGDISESVEDTVAELVRDNFTVIEVGKSTIIVPVVSESNRKKIEAFLENGLEEDFLKSVGFDASRFTSTLSAESLPDEEITLPSGRTLKQKRTSPFFQRVKETSYWGMNKSGDGVTLFAEDESNGLTDVVRDTNGSPIEVKFSQMGELQFVLDELQ